MKSLNSNTNSASVQNGKKLNSTFPVGMNPRNVNFPLKTNLNKSLGAVQEVKKQDSNTKEELKRLNAKFLSNPNLDIQIISVYIPENSITVVTLFKTQCMRLFFRDFQLYQSS